MTLAQNKQKLYYALQTDSIPVYETDADGNIIYYEDSDGNRIPLETGETQPGYAKPVLFLGNIAMSGGEVKDEEYGLSVADYDAVLIMQKNEIPVTETSRIWFESVVGYTDASQTIVDGDTADFRIVAIKPSLNTVKYVLKRIEK